MKHQKVPEHLIALVMALYKNARSKAGTLAGTSDEFGIGVGVHKGQLFVLVMQEATGAASSERLWDLLYANDL